jgi:hypothetical protein
LGWLLWTTANQSENKGLFTDTDYHGVLVDPWDSEKHEGQRGPLITKEEFAPRP